MEVRKMVWWSEARLNQWGNSELKLGLRDNNGKVWRVLKLAKEVVGGTVYDNFEQQ